MEEKGAPKIKVLFSFHQQKVNRELKQLRRRPQRQRQKTIGLMIKTTALHVQHAFKHISLTSTPRQRRENT